MILPRVLKYACSVALVIATCVPAGATTYPAAGGNGTATELNCGDDEYLVGFKGRTGNWIDEIRPLCATISPDGQRGTVTDDNGFAGGTGGSRSEFTCPADSYVWAMKIYVRNNLNVTSIHFNCYRPRDGESIAETVKFGVQTLAGSSQGYKECPDGEIGSGLNVRFGKYVNALGLMCKTLVIPKAAPPVASSKPKPSTTSTASSGPSTSTLSLIGEWKTTTSANRHFTLVLTPQIAGPLIPGQQIAFIGQFVSTDGARQFNGTLQGTAMFPSTTLNFTYVQPGLEAAGTGFFTLSSDGKTLKGTAVHMQEEKFAWNGGRSSAPPAPAAPEGAKASSTSSSSETSAPPATSTLEEQTDRPGNDYSQTNSDDPVKCRAKCLKDKTCAAWTWVQEGVQGDKGQCYLKDSVPSARPADCCVSGVITR